MAMCAEVLSSPTSDAARSDLSDRDQMIVPNPAVSEWSAERVVDAGDSHDKGELSLCVGEAA